MALQPSPGHSDHPINGVSMARTSANFLLTLISLLILLGVVGCSTASSPTPTITSTATRTPTSTVTHTPTTTYTMTPAFTITPLPSKTPSITPTPTRTLSPTPSPSPIPPRPAILFPYEDIHGKTVDWSYAHATRIGTNWLDEVNDLWAFMAFQLIDRGIHQHNFQFLGETITVYYLNVAHEFDGEMMPMQLVLGGTPGADIAIKQIPAGGTAYIQVQVLSTSDTFSPDHAHQGANIPPEDQDSASPLLFLNELQTLLPTLPDEIILLAEHPILFPPDHWPQIKLDMRRVSFLAARYQPFFEIDAYDRLADQSEFAYALSNYILYNEEMPKGLYAFSSHTLIIVTEQP
jgi:hypothetical protein